MKLFITDDFDLDKIINSGQCFRAAALPDGSYRFLTGRQVLRLRQTEDAGFEAQCSQPAWDGLWRRYFDLSRDYAAVRAAIPRGDDKMGEIAAFSRGIRILRQDPWETLVTFILSQRKNIPAIRGCVQQLCQRWGEPLEAEGEALFAFPTPEALLQCSEDELRSCGLGYRAPYVHCAAKLVAEGALPLDALDALSDDALFDQLKRVRGVGDKVANCVRLFAYGRVGCAPVDVWIARMIDAMFSGENPFPAYGDQAGILQQYMFYYALAHRPQ